MINQQVCSVCVMDKSAEGIYFDKNGQCNYCLDFQNKIEKFKINKKNLSHLVKKIKESNNNNEYDCIVGLSGGIDSSYTLVKVVESGLKPLVVHLDNGWNSELAQNNIENLIKKLDLDLFTYVIDWSEYREMMESFFKADVIDIELLMDNAMLAINYQLASKHKIKYILAGTNLTSEGMNMPKNMNWFKYDKRNILDIYNKFSNKKINTFPIIGTFDLVYYLIIKNIRWISFLDYFEYNKFKATEVLERDYGFKSYPYKHYESIFTRFYQGYLLPYKFGIDKRILHYSTLIISGQISRDEALQNIKNKHAYPNEYLLNEDKEYFLKKMGWNEKKLDDYLSRKPIKHDDYKTEKFLYNSLLNIYKKLKF